MIFDTHAHYDDAAFDRDREHVLDLLPERGVGRVVDVASTVESLEQVRRISDSRPYIYAAYGLHPDEVGSLDDATLSRIRTLLQTPKAVAVGEIGLDYHWNVEPREVQIRAFRTQILLALEMKKPIFVHSRDAAADTMAVIEELYGKGGPGADTAPKGVIHAYSYSVEMAETYTKLGFYLGIGGVLTFKNAKRLKKVVAAMPLGSLVLETDSPYLSPEPHRGERNASWNLPYVIRAVAQLKGVTEQEVEEVTWRNACTLTGTELSLDCRK